MSYLKDGHQKMELPGRKVESIREFAPYRDRDSTFNFYFV
jgi:hypothetical protein